MHRLVIFMLLMMPPTLCAWLCRSSKSPAAVKWTSAATTRRGLSYTRQDLPSETFFILDGTAMLFYSHFSREGQVDALSAKFSAPFARYMMQNLISAEVAQELLQGGADIAPLTEDTLTCKAVTAMALNFARFVRDVQPSYVAAVFDSGRKTFRSDLLPSYKKQRPKTPVELVPQMIAAPKVLQALGCHSFSKGGFEADDLMASLGRWARERGMNVVHVSGDKDMLQLIDNGIHVMNPRTWEILGPEDVERKFGVPPAQLVDVLALMGDSADNIPGARGIGPKIAEGLIRKFGSIENLFSSLHLAQLPELPHELKALKLSNAAEKALVYEHLSKTITADDLASSVQLLQAAVKGRTAVPILTSLYHTGFETLKLYKSIIRLRDDIDLETMLHHLPSGSDASLSKESLHFAPPALVNAEVVQTSTAFRFTGEKKNFGLEAEMLLNTISPTLSTPLRLLRQQYHKLDR